MDHLAEIFDAQEKLLRSLAPIYEHNEFELKNLFPFSLDARHAQEEFRLLAWRITEEVYEALQEYDRGPVRNEDKYREEVADVMHFFAELAIICGFSSTQVATGGEAGMLLNGADYLVLSFERVQLYPLNLSTHQAWGMFLTTLAHLMMEFRQRPWRTDDRKTNTEELLKKFALCWFAFCTACACTGISPRILHFHYFEKQKTNHERKRKALENVSEGPNLKIHADDFYPAEKQ
jgi:predicted house-cleaning noncanonical NTP pyrophosphatase (MazG superfamily)